MSHSHRRKCRPALGLEPLEGRRLLATVAGMTAPIKGALTSGISYIDLQGTAHGTPSTVVGNPDVGTTVNFQGAGPITGLGQAKVTGSLHGTGFIATGHVFGTITLTTAKGSLSLQLQGVKQGGFTAPGSGAYTYSVNKGTGAFKHDFGFGTVQLNLKSSSFTMTFQGKPNVY